MFNYSQNDNFPSREERVLQFWQKRQIFQQSLEQRKERPLFSTYDGPPFATGLPHYGHLLAGTIKDVIPRYKTMKGFYVPRRFGWDCHGLPIENEIEKAQELSGAAAIEHFGIAEFNEECRKIVLRYTSEWKKAVERMGRWVDFDRTYRTMDYSFMESVWWVFKELYSQDLIYEGFKVMPFSAKLGTPLSNFEANLNYKEVDDPSVVARFSWRHEPNTYFLAWTTTPWTLPSNLALIVGGSLDYVKLREKKTGAYYVLAEARVASYFNEGYEIVDRFKGVELNGIEYQPLFSFFANRAEQGAFRVVLDDFVSVDDGTGIVHAAPAFGETDFFVCKREEIDLVCPIDSNGRFTEEVPPYVGMFVKDADTLIIGDLKKEGSVFSQKTIRHRYPFCWRSDTPLLYKAVSTWFVAVEKIKERLLEANEKIHWVPEHIQKGRFGKWLAGARDWAISRNRYWGTPIPIWRSEDGECEVIGSIQELEKLTGAKVDDLHRHHIDSLSFEKNKKKYHRISQVFDCWFESGSMPYAQNHYPFENKEKTEEAFPADFIAEGLDQTRGWFYTLTVLGAALFRSPAFKNVIVNGIILAEDGAKMSKRLKNYPNPQDVIDRYGADAIRLYLLQSPAVRAEDLRFSERGVEQVLRQILIPFWNSFVFLSTYAKIYQWEAEELTKAPAALIDRWLLSFVQKTVGEIEGGMEKYLLNEAVDPLLEFIDQLTNWYIRRSRSRFWADQDTQDRKEAFSTLYTALLTFVKVAAPFIPFLSEAIYSELRTQNMPESVHLCDFPRVIESLRNVELEREVAAAQRAVSLGHSIRKEHKLKVRQPLSIVHLITSNEELLAALQKQSRLIGDELNVKEVVFHREETQFVQWRAKPNFPILGKKIGKWMPLAQKEIRELGRESIDALREGGSVPIQLGEFEFELKGEDVQIERIVKEGLAAGNEGELTVALDTSLNESLLIEGLARELVNKINTMRREKGLEVTDRIELILDTTPRVKSCFEQFYQFISKEVLATDVQFTSCEGSSWDLNGEPAVISIQKR